ncbi:hypothetical protein TSUD_184200 [Trifolium subterraneum]|uniref:Uncharacterized protein n=1 Tax=Trifolium subterraneum TaxID=3900 RepID=A0A2Z6PD41_TRISU|nr:hypothetical protein TSUD_184200 [Trifolium subterraneum]
MRNIKRRSGVEIDVTTPKKIAYNLRDRGQRTCYEDLSDSEIDLHVSFDNGRANHNKLVNSTNLQNSKADSTIDNRIVVLALEAMKTADNTTSVAQRAMKTEMAEPNTNMMNTKMVEPNTDLPKTEMVEPDTNLNVAGTETSNKSSGNSTTGEETVVGESGARSEIQIGQESPKRVPILPDLNLEPSQEDM